MAVSQEQVIEALREAIDPELGMNIVDMGLVYEVQMMDETVMITMTMTTPACPMGSYLTDEALFVTRQLTGMQDVDVQLTWSPMWNPMMMSPAAKKQLGWGYDS